MKRIIAAAILALGLLVAHAQPPTPPVYVPLTPVPMPLVTDVALRQLAPGVVMLTWASTHEICVARERDAAALGCSTAGALSDVWAWPGDRYALSVAGTVVARQTLYAAWLPVVTHT